MATSVEKAQQRVTELEEKLKQAKALKQKAEATIKTAEAKRNRANDTRRKVLIGALILEEMEKHEATRASIISRLTVFLTRPSDRALFDLPAAKPEATTT